MGRVPVSRRWNRGRGSHRSCRSISSWEDALQLFRSSPGCITCVVLLSWAGLSVSPRAAQVGKLSKKPASLAPAGGAASGAERAMVRRGPRWRRRAMVVMKVRVRRSCRGRAARTSSRAARIPPPRSWRGSGTSICRASEQACTVHMSSVRLIPGYRSKRNAG